MYPDIRWITPLYGFGSACAHIGVPEKARSVLRDMVHDLVRTSRLAAIYIPEGTEDVYQPGGMRGRVIGAVRLVQIPYGRMIEDYYYRDWDGSLRWPIGWPCVAVYAPDESKCPFLRGHVQSLHGPGTFGHYVARFQQGPIRLEENMRERLNRDFADFEPIA